jgi:hypothetical protein
MKTALKLKTNPSQEYQGLSIQEDHQQASFFSSNLVSYPFKQKRISVQTFKEQMKTGPI